MSSNVVRDRLHSASAPLASVDEAPVKHVHLRERSSIPSLLRGADAFTITRLESSSGLAERITKVSSVPALLVAVAILATAVLRALVGPSRRRSLYMGVGTIGGMALGVGVSSLLFSWVRLDVSPAIFAFVGMIGGWGLAWPFARRIPREAN